MTGVILLNMGGPDSPDSIRPFLYNLFSDRDIIKLGPAFLQKPVAAIISIVRAGHSKQIYSMIGGKSPMPAITKAQAYALQNELRAMNEGAVGGPFRVSVGMNYWKPFIKDAVNNMAAYSVDELVALSLYPQYSRATTGSAMKCFRNAADKLHIKYRCVESWYDHPLYIDALTEKIMQGMAEFSQRPVVLFSAHSLPQKLIDEGDPYLDQTKSTISMLEERIKMTCRLSFQSRSGPVKWLGPSTEETLADLADAGVKNLLVVPISFVSDHVETLYEIDILYKDFAESLGINLKRTESLNTSPKFIRCLADLVITSQSGQV
jgi:protoporphyrin/coproporphyrin ferrochelatase